MLVAQYNFISVWSKVHHLLMDGTALFKNARMMNATLPMPGSFMYEKSSKLSSPFILIHPKMWVEVGGITAI